MSQNRTAAPIQTMPALYAFKGRCIFKDCGAEVTLIVGEGFYCYRCGQPYMVNVPLSQMREFIFLQNQQLAELTSRAVKGREW